jgi:CspA family cold shock protein
VEGKVLWFNSARGYGRIQGADGVSYFCHWSNIQAENFKFLFSGTDVTFDGQQTERGGKCP